ncbi:MAG: carboxylesterase family protein [Pseudomonadota bacterium]|nr:carboxylesterase family protein [Pseudomonadota bacterium]
MSKILLITFFLFSWMITATELDKQLTVGDVEYLGKYQTDSNTFIFRGIPYAEPPINNLRWKSPIPAKKNLNIDARQFKAACMQDRYNTDWYHNVIKAFGSDPSLFDHINSMSEDCLYLNIWTKSLETSARKPVMVWIHGGNDTAGWSYEPDYIGHNLANKDVVVVSIGYRLNIFGFFRHPNMNEQTGNFGLEDQILALKWLKKNIKYFGGDPNNITIFGESAGGAYVSYHLVSPASEGLFEKAIIQSGGYNLISSYSLLDIQEAHNFAKKATDVISSNNFEALRNIDPNKLLDISKAMGYPFHPIIDGNLIQKEILNIYSSGDLNKVDLIIGSNKNEEYLYIDKELTLEDLIKQIVEMNPDKTDKIISLLDLSDIPLASDRLVTNQLTACPSIFIARQMTKSGNKVFQYLFSKQRLKSENILSYHGAEIPYVFGTHDVYLPTTNNDLKLTTNMMNYWTQFAKTGNPNSNETDVYWDEFGDDENYIILDTTIKTDKKMERELCDLIFKN